MSRITVRRVPLLWSIGMLAVLAALAWSVSGVLGTASAQTNEETGTGDNVTAPSPRTLIGFIKIGGIEGESTDEGHKDWINLLSVSQAIESSSTGPSIRSRSSATFGDIVVVKEVDKSTPKLMEAVAMGTHFPDVVIHLVEPNADGSRTPYLLWELKQARITSYSVSGSGSSAGDRPMESLSLNFEEIKVTYKQQSSEGSAGGDVVFTWDIAKSTK